MFKLFSFKYWCSGLSYSNQYFRFCFLFYLTSSLISRWLDHYYVVPRILLLFFSSLTWKYLHVLDLGRRSCNLSNLLDSETLRNISEYIFLCQWSFAIIFYVVNVVNVYNSHVDIFRSTNDKKSTKLFFFQNNPIWVMNYFYFKTCFVVCL